MEEDSRLDSKVQQAALMKELYNHPGFKILKEELEKRIADNRHSWLKAKDKEKAEIIRMKTMAYDDVYNIITGKIVEGLQASQVINNKKEV